MANNNNKQNAWEQYGTESFVTGVWGKIFSEVKNGVKFIIELDKSLTDFAYTSDVSKSKLEALGKTAVLMAKDLNTSAENVLEAAKTYSSANATAEDILKKSQPAIMLSNVSDMSSSESAKAINTTLNQFELGNTEEELLDIVDTLEYVSGQLNHNFAEGIKEIIEGIETSGSAAKNAGLNFQKYATMLGVAVAKSKQSGSTIGQAYNTVFSRITSASSTEGSLDTHISAAEESLRSVGIQVRDSANEFRDLTDIMADLNEIWDSLSSTEKSDIGYNVAGTRQLDILNSLFGAWQSYESIITHIDNRTGVTLKNQEAYADSLDGHLGNLAATGQSVWNNLIESEALKSGIDLLNGLLTVLNEVSSAFGSFGTIATAASGYLGAKGLGLTDYMLQTS